MRKITLTQIAAVTAWLVPLLSIIVGSILTAINTVAIHSAPAEVSSQPPALYALWPAGLVLLGTGVLALSATALVFFRGSQQHVS